MAKASSSSAAMVLVTRDEWLTAAMTDDQMVAELLLRLKLAKTTTAENPSKVLLPPLRWGVRQRRSRSSRFTGIRVGVAGGSLKKEVDSGIGSPVTPLSWSGGSGGGGVPASPSSAATADGFEETSRQGSCSTSTGSGSKAFPATEITSSLSNVSKKKKTFSELQDEQNLLLKERLNLEKEIVKMQTTLKEQSASNENLKRIKIDVDSACVRSTLQDDRVGKSNLEQACNPISSRKHLTSLVKEEPISEPCTGCSDGGFFMLPDLNMTPSEDDVCTETLYGTS